MNLRIEGQELRFRISKQELEDLCMGETLQQTTHLPNEQILHVGIVTNDNDTISLSYEKEQIVLHMGKGLVIALRNTLPSREGLKTMQDGLKLILEIDIRTQKRKRS